MKRAISNLLIAAVFISSAFFYKHARELEVQASAERAAVELEKKEIRSERASRSIASTPMALAPVETRLLPEAPLMPTLVREETMEFRPRKLAKTQTSLNRFASVLPLNGPRGPHIVGFGDVLVMTNQNSDYFKKLSEEGPSFGFKLGLENEAEKAPWGFFNSN